MTASPSQPPSRYANGRVGPGNSGRPLGARNRVSRRVALALLDQFESDPQALLGLLDRNPALYVKLLACVLPGRVAPPAGDQ